MKLEFPEKKHEQEHFEMIQEFTDNKEIIIPWTANLKEWENYDSFLERIKNDKEGKNLKPWYVTGTLYFLIDDNEKMVWAVAIRHELNDHLRIEWGNIAYGIRPSERKKWYATIWLQFGLEKCKELWMDKALLTCDKNNIWSSKTMIKNWWIFDTEYELKGKIEQRYRILIK